MRDSSHSGKCPRAHSEREGKAREKPKGGRVAGYLRTWVEPARAAGAHEKRGIFGLKIFSPLRVMTAVAPLAPKTTYTTLSASTNFRFSGAFPTHVCISENKPAHNTVVVDTEKSLTRSAVVALLQNAGDRFPIMYRGRLRRHPRKQWCAGAETAHTRRDRTHTRGRFLTGHEAPWASEL